MWYIFLKINGHGFWSDWNFSETSSRGPILTILTNIFSLKLFNQYAYQNWLQVMVLNFNWLFWIVIFAGAVVTFRRYKEVLLFIKNKTVFTLLTFYLIYFAGVLSFQTYTIPRYALPLEPIFLTALAASIYRITKVAKYSKYFIYALLISVAFVRLLW